MSELLWMITGAALAGVGFGALGLYLKFGKKP